VSVEEIAASQQCIKRKKKMRVKAVSIDQITTSWECVKRKKKMRVCLVVWRGLVGRISNSEREGVGRGSQEGEVGGCIKQPLSARQRT